MNTIQCPGLDGSNPLHFLASLGVMRIGEQTGLIQSMRWSYSTKWNPQYFLQKEVSSPSKFYEIICNTFVAPKISALRNKLEALVSEKEMLEQEKKDLESQKKIATKEKKKAIAHQSTLIKEQIKRKERKIKRINPLLIHKIPENAEKSFVLQYVFDRFPVVKKAFHLDDITKGGLTQEDFCSLIGNPELSQLLDLSGLAATKYLQEKRNNKEVTFIARTHFSFANNNSGKQLLKDFACATSLCTPSRIADALEGKEKRLDSITGLGWDPASQKSYALQFSDPQDEVSSQIGTNILAFIGLSYFTVCPSSRSRFTVGFSQQKETRNHFATRGTEEKMFSQQPIREYFRWPVWNNWISSDILRSILATSELAEERPSSDRLKKLGIAEGFQVRRFSANKRSFFSPSRSL